jgi:hypothetical protein
MTGEPAEPDRPDNLWQPVPDLHRAHGRFDDRASGSSWQLWADVNRGWLALGGGVAAGLIGAALVARGR